MTTYKLTKSAGIKRNDKWLKKSYTVYNAYYHNNTLPDNIVVRFGKPQSGSDAHWDPDVREIVVNESLNVHDALILICLHHEMAHVKMHMEGYVGGTVVKDSHHGMRYQAELDRLYKSGAYDGLL
jgi:hypothetical protein